MCSDSNRDPHLSTCLALLSSWMVSPSSRFSSWWQCSCRQPWPPTLPVNQSWWEDDSSFPVGPVKRQELSFIGLAGIMPIPEPMTAAIEMERPDWPGPDHVPTPESGGQVSPTQSIGTEAEGVDKDQSFTKKENGQWRSQDIRLDII